MGIDLGLALLRVVVGVLLVGHGLQKVTHLFGGEGLAGGVAELRGDGFRGGALSALAAGLGQTAAGALLAAGALTPAAASAAIGVMTVAATVKAPHGLWVQHDGYEFPLVLIVVAATLAVTGPGGWSVDALLGLGRPPVLLGLAATAVGLTAGFATRALLTRPTTP